MRKFIFTLLTTLLLLCFSHGVHAQDFVTGGLTAQATACPTNPGNSSSSTSALTLAVSNFGGATFTIGSTTFSGTLSFFASGDGGTTWQALNVTPTGSTTLVTTATATGLWQVNVSGFTHVCAVVTTFVSGTVTVTIRKSIAAARGGSGGGSGLPAGPTSPNGVPANLTSTPSGGVAGAGIYSLPGVPTDARITTTEAVAATDRDGFLTTSNAGAVALSIAQAGSGAGTNNDFTHNFAFQWCNIGAGTATLTPAISTISYSTGTTYTSGASSLALTTGQCVSIRSDNTNYFGMVFPAGAVPSGASQIQWNNGGALAGVTGSAVTSTGAISLAPTDTGHANSLTCPASMTVDCWSISDANGLAIKLDSSGNLRLAFHGSQCQIFTTGLTYTQGCNWASAATSGITAYGVGGASWGEDSNTNTPSYNAENRGTSSFTGSWNCMNVTPVTVNANSTMAQTLMACTVPAGTLNRVGRSLDIELAGVYTTPAAATPTVTIKVLLCSVSGCGSGNIATLLSIASTATLASVTNNAWNIMHAVCTTQTASTTLAMECHGILGIDLGAAVTSADSFFNDTNTATVTGSPSAIDSTVPNFLQVQVVFSTNQAGADSATQRQLVVQTVN